MGCRKLCSMPHGMHILIPFFLGSISLVLSFRTLSSCDLISTKWVIDCSTQISSQCVFKSNLNLGLIAKETYVNLEAVDDNAIPDLEKLTKVCQLYTPEEREWLLGNFWDIAAISQFSVIIIACIGLLFIGITSCYVFPRIYVFKIVSLSYGLCALASAFPLSLHYTSDFCLIEDGICNPNESSCVSSCAWGNGSWQIIGSCFMWLSAAFTSWLIPPASNKKRNIRKIERRNGSKSESKNGSKYDSRNESKYEFEDDESSRNTDDSGPSGSDNFESSLETDNSGPDERDQYSDSDHYSERDEYDYGDEESNR